MVFQSVKMRSTRSQAVRPSGDDALRELFTELEKGAVKSKRVSRVAGPSEIVIGEPCVVLICGDAQGRATGLVSVPR